VALRTGEQYIEGLRDDREVWIGGERVKDVTEHPAFRNGIRSVASMYDLQHEAELRDVLSFEDEAGERRPMSLLQPKSIEDLKRRGQAFRTTAQKTFGLMGRSPDFINSILTAWSLGKDVFAKADPAFGQNVVNYVDMVGRNDLCLTHAIMNPQVDRSKAASELTDADLTLHVVDETDEGIIVSGARLLATLGPLADELMMALHPGPPLKAGEEKYATAFCLPVATKGMRLICRQPLSRDGQGFDHPLASRFDEMDAFVICDRVLVPWDRVFINGDIEINNTVLRETFTPIYAAQQTTTRALVKAEFALALAATIADTIGVDGFINVQEKLGEMVDTVGLMRAAIIGAEHTPADNPWTEGAVMPNADALMSVRGLFPFVFPRFAEIIQQTGASGLINTPDEATLRSEIGDDVARYYQARNGSAEDRIRLFKLAWDFVGDGFGSRQVLYERFYAGDPTRLRAGRYMGLDKSALRATVESAFVR
jgi:4-hydroxyphenylacetate 3-monooxygenase oxygenase component